MPVSLSALHKQPERVNGKLTPWGAFAQHRRDSKVRNIRFEFEFADWVGWWEKNLGSDWFTKRGCKAGQYVMARYGDKGPYHPDNVKCITSGENHTEGNKDKPKPPRSPEHCLKLSLSKRGKPSPRKGIPMSEEQKAKLRQPRSQETKDKIRAARFAYYARINK